MINISWVWLKKTVALHVNYVSLLVINEQKSAAEQEYKGFHISSNEILLGIAN